jgi:hypothetical protein
MAKSNHAQIVARSRAKKASAFENMKSSINHHRSILKLPLLDFSKQARGPHVLKGMQRPNYLPPPELRATMTEEEVSRWRTLERLKRKALKSREARAEKAALWKALSAHLTELKQMVRQSKKSMMREAMVKPPGLEIFFAESKDPPNEADLIELDSEGNLKFDLDDEEFPILHPVSDEDASLAQGEWNEFDAYK